MTETEPPLVVVVTGPAGAGKSTVGALLARELGATFLDADDLHPPDNVGKMRRGVALTDLDREPWLLVVSQRVAAALAGERRLVVACSALKRAYRRRIAGGDPRVRFVDLQAPVEVLRERLRRRRGHWFEPDLLESQLATFEPSPDLLVVDATPPPHVVARSARRALGLATS